MKTKSRDEGITLVSIVITIIVMLILLSVSINYITGNDSFINKSKEARALYENSEENDLKDVNTYSEAMRSSLQKTKERIENDIKENESKPNTINGINIGMKTIDTLETGDVLNIQDENFIFLKKSSTSIIALAEYSLNVSTNSQSANSASTVKYYGSGTGNFNSVSGGSVPTAGDRPSAPWYAIDYVDTLSDLGATNVTTRLPTLSDISSIGAEYLAPKDNQSYWLANKHAGQFEGPYYITTSGSTSYKGYTWGTERS